jgi:pimeloyl-ACP methyl ester carboxylesterase
MPHTVSSDSVRIYYESFGRGVPAVLLHPANATSRAWNDLGWIDALRSVQCRPVLLDLRGFGESDPVINPDQLSPATSTNDIAAVLNALQIKRAHFCGFSLGAASALRFAVDRPARVQSLALGGLAVGPLVQVGLYLGATAEQARRAALTQLERPLQRASGSARTYFGLVRELLSSVELRPIVASDLRFPMLGVSGAADSHDSASLYRALRAQGARIRMEAISDVGHGGCFADPRFRECVINFLAEMPAAQHV